MLHLRDRKRLLRYDSARLRDSHFRWTQPGQLHVSVSLHPCALRMCVCVQMRGENNVNEHLLFRFFLMYLINKDETEHTGQVSVEYFMCFLPFFFFFYLTLSSCPSVRPPVLGVICVEDVPRALLGFLPSWWLFQEAIWGSAFLANYFKWKDKSHFPFLASLLLLLFAAPAANFMDSRISLSFYESQMLNKACFHSI